MASNPPGQDVPEEVVETTQARTGAYRPWTYEEEKELIEGMKKAKRAGLKSPQGFKPGGFSYLQAHMQKHFPGTDLRVKPHIKNRVRTMRDKHKAVLELAELSGMGWCDIKKEFSCSDSIWRSACKKHKVLNKIKRETFVFFDDWNEIYGTDRARGDGARAFQDAAARNLIDPPVVESSDDEADRGIHLDDEAPVGDTDAPAPAPSAAETGTKRPIPDEVDSNRNCKRNRRGKQSCVTDNESTSFYEMMNGIGQIIKEAVETIKLPVVVTTAAAGSSKADQIAEARAHLDIFVGLPGRARYMITKTLVANDELLARFNQMSYPEMEDWIFDQTQRCGEQYGNI